MLKKKLNFTLAALLGVSLLASVTITSCNNSGDAKDAKTDSTSKKEEVKPMTTDSTDTKSDTTKTQPVVPGN